MSERPVADMDGGWKQLIEDFLEEFFRFFFPATHARIDFRQECRHLDQELAGIMAGIASGRREVDKLIEFRASNGGTDLLLVHVEVQAQRDSDFARRMYVYNSRIRDRYGRTVESLALLVDGDSRFRPDRYFWQGGECRLEFHFPVVKLLDFKSEAELFADPSPIAFASLVQLKKLRAGRDVGRRFAFKVALARELYRRDYLPDDTLKLLRFMDYLLVLPSELADRFRAELERIEEELKMPYLTTWERKALEKGLEKGREKGREEGLEEGLEKGLEKGVRQGIVDALRQTLEVRFGEIPEPLLEHLEQCEDIDLLQTLHKLALTAESLDQLQF